MTVALVWTLAYSCTWLINVYTWLYARGFYEQLKTPILAPPLLVYAILTTLLMVCQMVACILIDLDHAWNFGLTSQVLTLAFATLAQVSFFRFSIYNFITVFIYASAAVFESLACWRFLHLDASTIWYVIPSAAWYVFLTASTFFIWVKNHRYPSQGSLLSNEW